jgi:hypothetical protein
MSNIKEDCGGPGCYKDCPVPCAVDEAKRDKEKEDIFILDRIMQSEGYHLTWEELARIRDKVHSLLCK